MRTIKFRLWGKNSKEFLQVDKKGYGLTLKEIQNIYDLDAWETQQFTGLTDKNGKEIYEGDIVALHKEGIIDGVNIEIKCIEKFAIECWQNDLKEKNVEIIGNIYENPELLK